MTTHTAAVTTVRLNAKVVAIIIASAIGAFLAGYAVYFFIASFRPEPTTSTREISTPARIRAVMYLSMDEVKATKNKPFTVDVMLDAKGTIINGADSVLTFDPKKVRIDNVATSPSPSFLYFPKADKQKGRVIITAIKQTVDDTPTEVLRLASISVNPIANSAWDGLIAFATHADPIETAMPIELKCINRFSAPTLENLTLILLQILFSIEPLIFAFSISNSFFIK